MADLSDVENAIVTRITQSLYPLGITQPSTVGATCRVFRGWPSPSALNSDLANGSANVTIFPTSSGGEIVDLYLGASYEQIVPHQLNAVTVADQVIFTGQPTVGEIVGLLVDGSPFVYKIVSGDTVEAVAANLAMQVTGVGRAIAIGATLVFPSAHEIIARVATHAVVTRGLRRQSHEIRISCWCPSAGLRDSVARQVDSAMASTPFLDLPDGTAAHSKYTSTQTFDQSQNALLYRRDVSFRCNYMMTDLIQTPIMLFGNLVRNGVSGIV